MIGNEEQAAGSEIQDNYEAVVLDFLDREMAAAQLTPERKNQSDELDALVSDLLKQVMTEADQSLPGQQSSAPATDFKPIEYSPTKQEAASSKGRNALPNPEPEPSRFDESEDLLAEYMRLQAKASSAEKNNIWTESAAKSDQYEDSDELLAEFMLPQDEDPFAEIKNVQISSDLESTQFEGMDAVLAEYMAPEVESAQSPQIETASPDSISAPGEIDDRNAMLAEFIPPQAEAQAAETEAVLANSEPGSHLSQNSDTPPAVLTAAPGTTSIPENKNVPLNPDPVLPKAHPLHLAGGTQKRQAHIASTAAPILARSLFATPVVHKSKAPWIAVASICVLAAVGVPTYYFSGSSGSTSKPARPVVAASQGSPNGEMPAIPISRVSPKYPELAVKNGASGSVVLELSISSEGKVVKATPVSGPELFHSEAVTAVMKWRYKPAINAGSKVASRSRVTLNFNLKN